MPRFPDRVFDALPGGIAWAAFAIVTWLAWAAPQVALLLSALVIAYAALRFSLAGLAHLRGLRRVQQWQNTDWQAHYVTQRHADALPWEAVQHLVIIPNYNEPEAVLHTTLERLAASSLARAQMTVVLAMEAAEPCSLDKARRLQSAFGTSFANFQVTLHPTDLPGEIRCKSANLAWAAYQMRHKLLHVQSVPIEHILVTTMDADTIWHPRHFEALTALFALDPQRHHQVWQAPIRYDGNIWSLPPALRLANDYASSLELATLAAPGWWALPMSSYTMSLCLLDRAGYWDANVIADEWHMFIKAFFADDARTRVQPVFLPFSVHVTVGDTLREAVRNRYAQTLRHAWGSKEMTYALQQVLSHPHLPMIPRLRLLTRVAHDVTLAGLGWLVFVGGGLLPILMHPPLLRDVFHDPLNVPGLLVIAAAFLWIMGLGAVFGALEARMRPPRRTTPDTPSTDRDEVSPGAFVLLPVLTFIFVTLPVLHAQTLLLLGRKLGFQVTRKL